MTSRHPRDPNRFSSGVASLIGDSGISLDGQSVQLPEDSAYDLQDDISSIHDSSYHCKGADPPQRIKIVGTATSMEEGQMEPLSPASANRSSDIEGKNENEKTVSTIMGNVSNTKRAPNMKKTSKLSVNGSNRDSKGCLPRWVSAAPRWLKFVIAFSTALLVGAVVMVTVAFFTELSNQNDTLEVIPLMTFAPGERPSQQSSSSPAVPTVVIFDPKPSAPSTVIFVDTETDAPPSIAPIELETDAPTIAKTVTATPQGADITQTRRPTPVPEVIPAATAQPNEGEVEEDEVGAPIGPSPTAGPGGQKEQSEEDMPQQDPTPVPYDSFVTTFFVTGGRFTNDALSRVPEQLRNLPERGGTSFLVHLGDWNSPYATRCDRQSYQDVDDLFSNSSIPVYFVPGDNDFNDCPDPKQAMSFWHEYLLEYETKHWNGPEQWAVARGEPDHFPENFAFFYNNILFVGINLVGGVVHDATEWSTRQTANLDWIDANYQQHKDNMKALVLFAHADPDVPSNSPFYEPFKQRVKKEYTKVPVVLIHRNLGVEPWSWETEFENINNLSVIVVQGSVWPPLMGAVDFRQERPFIFDQGNWYDEYMEHRTNTGK